MTILKWFQSPYIIFKCNISIPHILFLGELSLSKSEVLLPTALFTGCALGLEHLSLSYEGSPGGPRGKVPACQCRRYLRQGFDPWGGKIPWRNLQQPWIIPWTKEPGGLTVHRVSKSQTGLKQLSMHALVCLTLSSFSKPCLNITLSVKPNSGWNCNF